MRNSEEMGSMDPAPSYLITGGCDLAGRVPILEHREIILNLPRKSIKIAHTGLVDKEDPKRLSELIDIVSFNFVGEDRTIREIYGLDRTVQDYVDSYRSLSRFLPTYPHMTIGLDRGRVVGEMQALDILEGLGVESLVLNLFIPTIGTVLEHVPPPPLGEVRKLLRKARGTFENVYLGCMRPGGSYRRKLDVMAVEEELDRIVNPTRPARELASRKGFSIEWKEECCII